MNISLLIANLPRVTRGNVALPGGGLLQAKQGGFRAGCVRACCRVLQQQRRCVGPRGMPVVALRHLPDSRLPHHRLCLTHIDICFSRGPKSSDRKANDELRRKKKLFSGVIWLFSNWGAENSIRLFVEETSRF